MHILLPPLPAQDHNNCAEFVSEHYVKPEGYQVRRSRGTTTALLFFTRKGRGFFRTIEPGREAVHTTGAGELVLVQTGYPQSYGTVPGEVWDFHWVHFHPKAARRPWLQLPPLPGLRGVSGLQMPPDICQTVETLFEAIHQDARMGTRTRRELALNSLERILLLGHEQVANNAVSPMDSRVRDALEKIAADPAQPHTVTALAQSVGLSPSRFAHLFAEQTGDSVTDTVLRARLAQAERLLSLSSGSVSEIAFAVGFSSLSLFTRHFTRRYGCSPRAFRSGKRKGKL